MTSLSAASAPPKATTADKDLLGHDARSHFDRHRSWWALGIGSAVAALTGLVSWQASKVANSDSFAAGPGWREAPIVAISGQQILSELAAVRHRPGGPWASEVQGPQAAASVAGGTADALTAAKPDVASSAAKQPAAGRQAARRRAGAAGQANKRAEPAALDAYAAVFGAPEQYRAGNALHAAAATGSAPVGGKAVEGTLLAARLQTEVASIPSGGPVIAILQRPVRLANGFWPRGTEVHGICNGSGNSDTRVFVTFEALRLPSGRTQSLRGVAVDLQGRHGIPGRKILSRQSAGSIGLAAASSAARTLGRTLAGSAGAIFGSGIEGAAASGQSKMQRLDQDEYVVLVARGTPLQIYLTKGDAGAQPGT